MKNEGQVPDLTALQAALTQRGSVRDFAKGESVVTEGEKDASLYLLVSGRMKVFARDQRGREVVYNEMRAGEFFGEMGLDGGARSASVRAMEPSRCVVVARGDLDSFMRFQPELATHLVLTLIGRLRRATRQVRSLALSDTHGRVVELLHTESLEEDGRRRVPSSLTQREIASRVGASREMIGQILRELKRGGFLVRDGKRRLWISGELPQRR